MGSFRTRSRCISSLSQGLGISGHYHFDLIFGKFKFRVTGKIESAVHGPNRLVVGIVASYHDLIDGDLTTRDGSVDVEYGSRYWNPSRWGIPRGKGCLLLEYAVAGCHQGRTAPWWLSCLDKHFRVAGPIRRYL